MQCGAFAGLVNQPIFLCSFTNDITLKNNIFGDELMFLLSHELYAWMVDGLPVGLGQAYADHGIGWQTSHSRLTQSFTHNAKWDFSLSLVFSIVNSSKTMYRHPMTKGFLPVAESVYADHALGCCIT
ncbi:hypothetical protein EDD18DRAFT_1098038 [Armillaria luteobubalina]|uniref:Uncharacterized protein n=1 Tax=Armillaria luteobubalina TaxID=153913 RepID=A0AA39QRK5_9AGAR|nr:hypothetical protein EDD18DRAFT_1098038 [Armillaria luteobubalina]